jgi:hypothetical protein
MHHQSWKLCGEVCLCPVRSYHIFIIDNPWMLAIASFKVFLFCIWKRYKSETISDPIHNFGPIYSKIAHWRVPYVTNWWRNREILTMEPFSTCLDESITFVLKSIGWFSFHKLRSHEFLVELCRNKITPETSLIWIMSRTQHKHNTRQKRPSGTQSWSKSLE